MRIGEAAKQAGCAVQTVRYYEREGLLDEAARSGANYRLYSREDVERLVFIRNCRALDMKLDEIRELLRLKDSPAGDCRDVGRLLDEHIGHVAERIAQLQAVEKQLKQLRERCVKTRPVNECGILRGLGARREEGARAGDEQSHIPGAHSTRG